MPAELLPAGSRAFSAVPAIVHGTLGGVARCGRASVLRPSGSPYDGGRIQRLPRSPAQARVGGLRQTSLWWSRPGLVLSSALHPPCGDLKQQDTVTLRWQGLLSMEGLSAGR